MAQGCNKEVSPLRRWVMVILTLLATAALTGLVGAGEVWWRAGTETAPGQVVYASWTGRVGAKYQVSYEYGGQSWTMTDEPMLQFWQEHKIGDKVQVRFNPKEPNDAKLDGFLNLHSYSLVILAFGLFMTLGTALKF